MSSFKKLSKADVTTVPYRANKRWNLPYTCFSGGDSYFSVYKGTYITGTFSPNDIFIDPITNGQYERLVYDSINHLFYQSYSGSLLDTGSIMFNVDTYQSASQQRPTGSYFDYNVNPLLIKNFPTGANAGIRVLAINQEIYGSKVLPYSFNLSSSAFYLIDDGNGNLYDAKGEVDDYILTGYISQSYFLDAGPDLTHIGNIFYAHGLAVITNTDYQDIFPLPPLAHDDSVTYTTLNTGSKVINILSNDISRSCALDTGSVILSGSNSVYYTVNPNGTVTLNTSASGNYDVYYTVNSICGNGCSLISNKAKISTTIINIPIYSVSICIGSDCTTACACGTTNTIYYTGSFDAGTILYSDSILTTLYTLPSGSNNISYNGICYTLSGGSALNYSGACCRTYDLTNNTGNSIRFGWNLCDGGATTVTIRAYSTVRACTTDIINSNESITSVLVGFDCIS
jgi:hypothetical protein